MPSTRQDLAVAAANTLLGLMLQFRDLRQKTAEFLNQYNSEAYGSVWAALPTAPWNPDGTLGATDPSPAATHPVTAGGLNRPSNALALGIAFLNDYQKFLNGQDVPALPRHAHIDDLVS